MKTVLFLIGILFSIESCSGDTPPLVPPDEETRRLVSEWVERRQPELSIVVGVLEPQGKRVISYGRLDGRRAADANTVFEIGSATKVFTSLLLADMVTRGEVRLSDPVSRYMPAGVRIPERGGRSITLEDLATHRSGLPRMPMNFFTPNQTDPYRAYSTKDLYRFLAWYPLPRDIGTEYEYSNLGAGLLGHAPARAAEQDYEALLLKRVIEPLEMSSTGITLSPAMQSHLALGHDTLFDETVNWNFTEAFAGAGALRSTANDLLTFLAAQLGYTTSDLSAAITQTRSTWRPALSGTSIGLGWMKRPGKVSEIIWHGGGTGGYSAFVGFDPAARSGVVVLANLEGLKGNVDTLGLRLLGEDPEQFPPWAGITLTLVIGAGIITSAIRGKRCILVSRRISHGTFSGSSNRGTGSPERWQQVKRYRARPPEALHLACGRYIEKRHQNRPGHFLLCGYC